MAAPIVIPRKLAIGLTVPNLNALPGAGKKLAAFLAAVDHAHGTFELDIAVSVGGAEAPMAPVVVTMMKAAAGGDYEEVTE